MNVLLQLSICYFHFFRSIYTKGMKDVEILTLRVPFRNSLYMVHSDFDQRIVHGSEC